MLSWFFRMKLYFLRQGVVLQLFDLIEAFRFFFLFSHTHIHMHAYSHTYTLTQLIWKFYLIWAEPPTNSLFWLAFIHSLSYFHLPLTLNESLQFFLSWWCLLNKIKIYFFASFSFLFLFWEKKLSSHIIITRVVPIMIIIFMCVHNFHLYK